MTYEVLYTSQIVEICTHGGTKFQEEKEGAPVWAKVPCGTALNPVAAGEGGLWPAQAGGRLHPLLHVAGANQLPDRHGLA